MPTNGNSFEADKTTGYLTPKYQGSLTVFGSESKVRFIKIFEETGDLSKACDMIGVSYQTMRDHVKLDEAFARDLNITLSRMESQITGVMFKKALEPNGTMDRFGWLRAHNRDKWNPSQRVTLSTDNTSVDALWTILESQGRVLDVTPRDGVE